MLIEALFIIVFVAAGATAMIKSRRIHSWSYRPVRISLKRER